MAMKTPPGTNGANQSTLMQAETPRQIGHHIADAGALLKGDERNGIVHAAAEYIRAERKGAVHLTKAEARAALAAISQMTVGNAQSFEEWRSQTSGTLQEWQALIRAETKLKKLVGGI